MSCGWPLSQEGARSEGPPACFEWNKDAFYSTRPWPIMQPFPLPESDKASYSPTIDGTTVAVGIVIMLMVAGGAWALVTGVGKYEEPRYYWVELNYRATQTIGPDNEISLAANPTDPRNLIAGSKDYFLGEGDRACDAYRVWSGVFWSMDGGKTWENSLFPGYDEDGDPDPGNGLADYDCVSDPVVAFGPDGTAYYSGLAVDRGGDLPIIGVFDTRSGIWVARSLDNGSTWSRPKWVDRSETQNEFHDKQWFTVDPFTNYVYVTWSQFYWMGTYFKVEISFSRLTDWDSQFQTRVPLGDYISPSISIQGSMPVVGPDGTIHVTWMDHSRGCLRYTRSDRQGAASSWDTPRCVADAEPAPRDEREYRTPTFTSLTVDNSDANTAGNLYAVWEDRQWGDVDAAFTMSTDGGDTWSDPESLSPDGEYEDSWNFFPWLDVDDNGLVHLIYYTEHWALMEDNDHLDVAYRYSSNGGVNWTEPYRLTTRSFDPLLGYHQRGQPFIGDYNQIDTSCYPDGESWAYAGWADTRTGESELWTAAIEVPLPEGTIDEMGVLWL